MDARGGNDKLNSFLTAMKEQNFEVSAWEPARRCRPRERRAQQAYGYRLCRSLGISNRTRRFPSERADDRSEQLLNGAR
jgi:hypothetical protein